jgi:hyperosmotically inducible protein
MILNNRGRRPEHGNMNNPLFQIRFLITIILLGLVFGFLLTGCGSQNDSSPVFSAPSDPGGPRSFLTTWDDSVICARVKTKMISDDFIKAAPIDVDVYNGVVYLTGIVQTDSQKRMAADLARGVEGVVKVKNHLILKIDP